LEGGNEMSKALNGTDSEAALKYRRVAITAINKGRRGKHHDLIQGILRELGAVPSGSAIEIPLAEIGGIGLANLRSAVHRASMLEGLSIETRADENNLYVWNTTT
jgi:hypothetical protein